MATSKPKPSFEELYRQLEDKVALLEQGGLSLDDSLAAFEEAVSLAQRCQEMLETAEQRITRLRETIAANGRSIAEPEALYKASSEAQEALSAIDEDDVV
ncbi:MAG TPA: exodeoxyribonuclease VII small subunit [Dehalococcoidia bacterium]|nr:exodeoxyribonuclease VII small subunit [Dehalococcoidia bacterium]